MSGPAGEGKAKPQVFRADFPPEEFAERRAKVMDAIGEEACALLQGAPPGPGFMSFRQSNEFYHLCGVETAQAYLLIDGAKRTAELFMIDRDLVHPEGDGPCIAREEPDEIVRLTGLDAVSPLESLELRLAEARVASGSSPEATRRGKLKVLYVPHKPSEGHTGTRGMASKVDRVAAADPWDGRLGRQARLISLLRARRPGTEIRDLSPILDKLRARKSPREVAVLRRAGRLTALATAEAMRSTAPGVMEYQLGAVAQYIFLANGARGVGYCSIIASGGNARFGHYHRNDSAIGEGDLILVDWAPDYGYYTSDIGRMWPGGGAYSPQQRELYGFVVEYHKALLKRIRPGVTAAEVSEDAAKEMAELIEKTAFSKPIYEEAARRMLEFRGHMSHPVGMAVHDVGGYRDNKLTPGTVFSVDPQMRVPEEKLYIRCEDTIAVTEEGYENLTDLAPLELDDVEAVMREEGLLQKLPPDALPEA